MNRHLRLILLVLLVGAIINVGVAWIVPNAVGDMNEITITYQNTGITEKRWRTSRERHGWPMIALVDEIPHATGSVITTIELGSSVELAVGPAWPGILVNTLFYAALLWLFVTGLRTVRRFLRFHRRRCIHCAYDLRGSRHERCPECGGGIGTVVIDHQEHIWLPLRALMLIVNGAMFVTGPVIIMVFALPPVLLFDFTKSLAHILFVGALLPIAIVSFLAIGVSVDPYESGRKGLRTLATAGTAFFALLAIAMYAAETNGRVLSLMIVTLVYGIANIASLHVPRAHRANAMARRGVPEDGHLDVPAD